MKTIIWVMVVLLLISPTFANESAEQATKRAEWIGKKMNEINLGTEENFNTVDTTLEYNNRIHDKYGMLTYTMKYTSAGDLKSIQKNQSAMPVYTVNELNAIYYDKSDREKFPVDTYPIMDLVENGDLIEIMAIARHYILVRIYVKEYFYADSNDDDANETYTRFTKNDLYVFKVTQKKTEQVNSSPLKLTEFENEEHIVTKYIDAVKVVAMAGNGIAIKLFSSAVSNKVNYCNEEGTGDVTYEWRQNQQLIIYDTRLQNPVQVGEVLTDTRNIIYKYVFNKLADYKDYGDSISITPYYDTLPKYWEMNKWNFDYQESYDSNGQKTIDRDTGFSDTTIYQ